MIDSDLSEDRMKQVVQANKSKMDFVEPQSMNFDKKINQTYKEFLAKQTEAKQPDISNVKNKQVFDLTEDLLF